MPIFEKTLLKFHAYSRRIALVHFFAEKKFSEAELNFETVEYAAKAAIMASFSYYGINFYPEATSSLKRFISNYPADKNIAYAHYLSAIILYEQILDEKKGLPKESLDL